MTLSRLAFGVSAVSSIVLAIVYSIGGHVQLEGVLLGLGLGGLGVGLVAWGFLLPHGDAIERRHEIVDRSSDQHDLGQAWSVGEEELNRRGMLRWAAAAFAALAAALVFPIRSLGPAPGNSLRRTPWRDGMRVVDENGEPFRIGTLEVNGVITVFPEGHVGSATAQAMLLRLDQSLLKLTGEAAAWAPQGHVAYSKVCTHAGCPVGLFEQGSQQLLCPCHQSTFDVLDGAKPVFGPATRPLPQLPLGIDGDGWLIALGDYREPIGPGFWDRERPA